MKAIIKEYLKEPMMLLSVFCVVTILSANIVAVDYTHAVTKLIAFTLNMFVGILYIYLYVFPSDWENRKCRK